MSYVHIVLICTSDILAYNKGLKYAYLNFVYMRVCNTYLFLYQTISGLGFPSARQVKYAVLSCVTSVSWGCMVSSGFSIEEQNTKHFLQDNKSGLKSPYKPRQLKVCKWPWGEEYIWKLDKKKKNVLLYVKDPNCTRPIPSVQSVAY